MITWLLRNIKKNQPTNRTKKKKHPPYSADVLANSKYIRSHKKKKPNQKDKFAFHMKKYQDKLPCRRPVTHSSIKAVENSTFDKTNISVDCFVFIKIASSSS